jgi:hypothetical protein
LIRSGHRSRLTFLMIGWGLGVLTVVMWPMLASEQISVVVTSIPSYELAFLAERRWVVLRTDTIGLSSSYQSVVTLERPRYLALGESLDTWSSDERPTLRPLWSGEYHMAMNGVWDTMMVAMFVLAGLAFMMAYRSRR